MVYTIYHPSSRRAHGALRWWWSVCGRQPPRSVVSFKLPINSSSAREQKFNTALVKPYPRCLVVLKLLFAFFFSSGDLRKKNCSIFFTFHHQKFSNLTRLLFFVVVPIELDTFEGGNKVFLLLFFLQNFISRKSKGIINSCLPLQIYKVTPP